MKLMYVSSRRSWWRMFALFLTLLSRTQCLAEWLTRIEPAAGVGSIQLAEDPNICFLEFGNHSFAPDSFRDARGDEIPRHTFQVVRQCVAPFQGLALQRTELPSTYALRKILLAKDAKRDPFWDQMITVDPSQIEFPEYSIVEAGRFGEAVISAGQSVPMSRMEIESQRQSKIDSQIPPDLNREMQWDELAGRAYPLDFQKVLVASPHDSSPGFVFQNGQWFTTWPSQDLPKWTKEDHWFAPAILIGKQLIRPAPLSARSNFVMTPDGRTLPIWTLEWRYHRLVVSQTIFSHPVEGWGPHVHVELRMSNAPAGARLAIGVGRRPNVHYWDDQEHDRTPIPFFSLSPGYKRQGQQLVDRWDHTLLVSGQEFRLEELGPAEMLLVFEHDENGAVHVRTPQSEIRPSSTEFSSEEYETGLAACKRLWRGFLTQGAQVKLPSDEWMKRIDIWRSQLQAITRVNYQGQDRLSYGAYFYQAYFGPEEGWSTVALAQWGHADEAKRQADIMLSAENRSKENVHHQSRNGVFGWYAAEVARLTDDRRWLDSITPALVENAEWTIRACHSTKDSGPEFTRGLLPPHIYGGDIRDPATSLYATAVCWKGLVETGSVLRELGSGPPRADAERFQDEANALEARLRDVISAVADRGTEPPFLPLALALPSLGGKNEGPYDGLTASRLGNYWNLFAPSVMELGLVSDKSVPIPNSWLLGYMESHGGLWAGLPRFHDGLDAAYSMGVIRELLSRSMRNAKYRNRALATLHSFFLHAASRNGFTIPEVAGLFPYRLDGEAYERLVRQSPWNFGMYNIDRYLEGHISFTEPLGAGAGEALWLIRNALIAESVDEEGEPDSQLFLLSTVPGDWYQEGKVIELNDFPTHYGKFSMRVDSRIESAGEITLRYKFESTSARKLKSIIARFAPPNCPSQDIKAVPQTEGVISARFERPAPDS